MIWAAFFICGFLCTSSQYLYVKESDRCTSSGKTMVQIRELLLQQERIQKSVDSLRQMVKRLEENTGKIHEDVEMVKRGLKLHTDCQDYYVHGHKESGVYLIDPFGNSSLVTVFCDTETEGGGWTAIQKRVSGTVGFNRTWAEYKKGFGNPADSYWIGNDVIRELTKARSSALYVSITLKNGTTLYELYHRFSVSDESDNYRLFIGGPSTGTLGHSNNLSGYSFSTQDRDNDKNIINCAADNGGGWWINSCHHAFLNGPWSPAIWTWPWYPAVKDGRDIKETLMMTKPHL